MRRLLASGCRRAARDGAGLITIATRGEGGWHTAAHPACYSDGKTHIGSVDSGGRITVRSYTNATGAQTIPFTLARFLPSDWHDSPALVVRASDSKIVTAYSDHDGASMYCRISTNANDASAWGSATDLDSTLGGTLYCYPVLTELTGEGNKLYLFYRDHQSSTGVLAYSTSTNGGATWSAQTALYQNTNKASYWRIVSNGVDRIDILTTDGTSHDGDAASVYHFYLSGGNRYKSDGTQISASLPLAPADLTKAYDGATYPARFVAGAARVGSEIAAIFPVHLTNDYGWRYARWNGSTWTTNSVVNIGTDTAAWEDGGADVDPADLDSVLLTKYAASSWQVHDYRTTDAGASWTSTQLTWAGDPSQSPAFITNHGAGLRALLVTGPLAGYASYNLAIMGVA